MKFTLALGLVLVTTGALLLRLPQLSQRPMHTDESVHAIKFMGLWEAGDYRYDPQEYHGPSLYYAALPSVWLRGVRTRAELHEGLLRFTPAVFGAGLILLLLITRRAMGTPATLATAVLLAVSPAMVFYSRYFIHEMLLVVFTFSSLACGWRYVQKPGAGWMIGAGASLGLMQATKETFVFPVFAAVGAMAALAAWRWLRSEPEPRRCYQWRHWLWGAGAFLAVYLLLFSSFLQNGRGPLDAWLTYGPWFARAEGDSPHVHPWYYYASLLIFTHRGSGPLFTEALILLLGLIGAAASLFGPRGQRVEFTWGRFCTFYTLLLTAVYCVVPYKTPWCLLGFWHGWILLAGLGVAAAWGWRRQWLWRGSVAVGLAIGVGHLAIQAHRVAFGYADSQRNPYVYAHTLSSLLELVERVEQLERVAPQGTPLVVKVMAAGGDYWPLPWYLRRYPAGWYSEVPVQPDEAMASVLITSPQYESALHGTLGERVTSLGMFGLRPGVFLQLHVESGLWARYLEETLKQPAASGASESRLSGS